MLKVKIIAHTPKPDKVVAQAGKLCYSAVGVDEIAQKLTEEEIARYVNMLASIHHESPLEHVSFTFAIEGISRVLTHQLVRHRLASYSQQSQRYVKLEQFEYIVPPAIEKNEKAKALFIETMEKDQEAYNQIVDELINDKIREFKKIHDRDLTKKEYSAIEKQAIEDARYVFPNACETKIICTMNLRSLINFCHHRCCRRAQEEINKLAWTMVEEIEKVRPLLAKSLGASCQFGPCPEGDMCCMMPYEKKNK